MLNVAEIPSRTHSNLRSVLTIVLASALAACTSGGNTCGPGTHAESGVCVVDSSADAGADALADATTGDASNAGDVASLGDAPPIRAGDILAFDDSFIAAIPGIASCTSVSILHSDGSGETLGAADLPSLRVTTDSDSIATGTEPGDCRYGRVGVIGVAPGTTRATVTLTRGGQMLTATANVGVYAGTLRIDPGSVLDVVLDAESDGPQWYPAANVAASSPDAPDALTGCNCQLVPRWLNIEVADRTIATVDHQNPAEFEFHGLARGTTSVTAVYTSPGSTVRSDPHPLTVLGGGVFDRMAGVNLRDDAGELVAQPTPLAAIQAPGTCLTAHLMAYFLDGASYYAAELKSGVTWSTRSPSAVASGAPGRYCAAERGDARIVGCSSQGCRGIAFPVYAPGDVAGLSVTVADAAPVPLGLSTETESAIACPHVRLTAALADGSTRDVTDSPLVAWTNTSNGMQLFWPRALLDDLGPVDDAGYPCVFTSPPMGQWGHTDVPVHAAVRYANHVAEFDYAVSPP